MTKKKFLEELEKKLKILDELERRDIINEYSDVIDEKIKNGKTEKEAIEDFGDLNELVTEILKAYKINPDFNSKEENGEKFKDFVEKSDSVIKNMAMKMSNFTKQLASDIKGKDNNFSIEFVFEIIIKSFILLCIFLLLRFPFWIINEMGIGILNVAFDPFDQILIFFWSIIVTLIYFLTCILIGILMFKQNIFKPNSEDSAPLEKSNIKDKKNLKTKIETQKSEVENNNSHGDTGPVLVIFKILIIIFLLIPIIFINLSFFAALSFLIYMIIKGVNVVGPIIVVTGFIIIGTYMFNVISNLIYNRKRVYLTPFVAGFVFIILGGLLTIDMIFNITFYNKLPNNRFEPTVITYVEEVDNYFKIAVNRGERNIIIDNNLEDNKILIEIVYYDKFSEIKKFNDKYDQDVYIEVEFKEYKTKEFIKNIIIDLKNNEVYNYKDLYQAKIKIYANSNTVNLIN